MIPLLLLTLFPVALALVAPGVPLPWPVLAVWCIGYLAAIAHLEAPDVNVR